MKAHSEVLKNLTLLSQLGLSLIAPLLICLFFCNWLATRYGIGGWIYIPGFFFGLGGSAMTAYKIYLGIVKKEKKRKNEHEAAFNKHL